MLSAWASGGVKAADELIPGIAAELLRTADARFGVQGTALSQVHNSVSGLAQTLREALSANDGRGIAVDLTLTFSSVVGALNETWNGQPLFAGERQGYGLTVEVLHDGGLTTRYAHLSSSAVRPGSSTT